MKRVNLLAILFSLVMVFGLVPVAAFAADGSSTDAASGDDTTTTVGTGDQTTDATTDTGDDQATDTTGDDTGASDDETTDQTTTDTTDETATETTPVAAQSDSLTTESTPTVSYCAHVQDVGWQDWVSNGALAGTTGQSKRVEALRLKVEGSQYSGSISYSAHVQDVGWQDPVADGDLAGTSGRGLRVEALKISLSGDIANYYDVYYRVHVQDVGWMAWASDGQMAGTSGMCKRIEALEVVLVPKGAGAPSTDEESDISRSCLVAPSVTYRAHVQNIGWQHAVSDGATAGTTGRCLRVEALKMSLSSGDDVPSGSISYRAHVQNIGWQDAVSDGDVAGTTGQSLRTEAVQISLSGEVADYFDVYYRVHIQDYGWLDWACDGQEAGSTGMCKRIEAIEIMLVPKGNDAPGSTDTPVADNYYIMGDSSTSVDQMVAYWNDHGSTYPAAIEAKGGAPTIEDFCQIIYEESQAEGVNAEVVFAQAMYETGWLQFGNAVTPDMYNYAGIGAIDSDAHNSAYRYKSVRMGIRAQVQHLKAYASTDDLNQAEPTASNAYQTNIVDGSRYAVVEQAYGLGSAPTVGELSTKWASSSDYGNALLRYIHTLAEY